MSIIRIRDAAGNVQEILAIKGEQPVNGVDYNTPEEKEAFVKKDFMQTLFSSFLLYLFDYTKQA